MENSWLNKYEVEKDIYLIHGDCLKFMPRISDESMDLILADPPYNVGQKFTNDNLNREDYLRFMDKWITISYKVLREGGTFYMFHYFLGMWDIKSILDKQKWEFINLIIWAYPNLMPSNKAKKYRWPLSYQPIFFYGKNYKKDLIGRLYGMKIDERKDVWLKTATQSNFKREFRYHPSCKPISVIRKIIQTTEETDAVLDPFMGSGTTGVACKELGRTFIGIEIEKRFYDIARQRVKRAVRNML